MKILKAKIQNFLIIGEAEIVMSDRGLVLIQGDNQDDTSATSNGAGKSTIADAVCWCLYGETARGVSGDEVINDKIGKDCFVHLTVEDDGIIYVIMRHRKCGKNKNGLLVFNSTLGIELTKGTTALTQEVINQIIGCSHDVFVASAYVGQEMMPDLPSMTDKQLKMLIEEAAGTEQLQKAYELALDKNKTALSQRSDITSQINGTNSMIASYEANKASIIDKSITFRNDKVAEQVKLQAHLVILRDELGNLPHPLSSAKIERVQESILTTQDKMESAVGEERSTLAELDAELKVYERAAHEAELGVKSATTEAKKAKESLDKIQLRVGTKCGECGKEYHEHDIDEAKVHAQITLNHKLMELSNSKKRLVIAQESLRIAQERRAEFEASMTDISALLDYQRKAQAILDDSKEKEAAIKQKQAEIDVVKSKIDKIEEEIKNNQFQSLIDEQDIKMVASNESLKRLEELLASCDDLLEKAKVAIDVFGRAGARAHILDSVTPFLNERTAEYLGILTDGNITAEWSTISATASGELREKFSISVEKRNGSKKFAGLSGGEKRKVRLATAMALQDLVASRATKSIGFQFLDEIDDAIDEAGLERLMTILQQKGREKGSVFVISHNDLNSYIANVIKVKNVGGISTVIDN